MMRSLEWKNKIEGMRRSLYNSRSLNDVCIAERRYAVW